MKRIPHPDWRLPSLLVFGLFVLPLRAADPSPPNVILCMADDLGWQDVGFNGNDWIQTPHLDKMASQGIRFERFYSASAVCSPTRASCLTGRNSFRTGVFTANNGILRPEEITIAELLQEKGYATGMFGKWHLGTFTTQGRDANRGRPKNAELVNRPDEHGFDVYFATESKVPTYDPMKSPSVKLAGSGGYWDPLAAGSPAVAYGTHYWTNAGGPNRQVTKNLEGDDSRVIMDRALPFIEQSVQAGTPFLAVIWFHAPHLPCVSSPEFLETYKHLDLKQRNYAGCVAGLDQQMGRLRSRLVELGAADNTMVWFCSDNGPEGQSDTAPGSAGPLKGRKRSLFDGGIRVPGVVVWPSKIKQGRVVSTPCITSDYLPTIMEAAGVSAAKARFELDGVSLMPLLEGKPLPRKTPLCFQFKGQANASTTQYKFYQSAGREPELYDMLRDPGEQTNLAARHPDRLLKLRTAWRTWQARTQASFEGREYGTESVKRINQQWQDVIPQRSSDGDAAKSETVPAVERVNSDANDVFRFEKINENSLGLWQAAAPVLVYNHGAIINDQVPENDHRRRRACYIHPVYGLNGEIFVHPDHPDFPPTWLLRHYGPLCVGWPGVVTKTLMPGKPVQLDYRIWIHDGTVDTAELEKAYADYGTTQE